MASKRQVITTVLLGLAASPALAQDSVSRNSDAGNGLPGDALNAWAAGVPQRANYVVDLAQFTSSAGSAFGIGPILKSSKTSTARFTGLNGTSLISQTVKTGASYPASSYTAWSAATAGLNANENNTALNSSVPRTGTATVFGVAFMDFDEIVIGTSNVFVNQVYGAQIAFDPALPSRLYVTRVGAASNATNGLLDRSQFGLGSIDADGNLCFRADSFGSTGAATTLLVGDNYFRIKLPLRSTTVNQIDNNGGSSTTATDWVLQRSTTTHAVPTGIPADLAGRSVLMGADFAGQYRYESGALTTSTTTAHRPGTIDDRGNLSFSAKPLFAGSLGSSAILSRSNTGGGKTDSISVFGVDANGAVTGSRTITLPSSLTDSCDLFPWPVSGGDLRNYDSQVTFRGGSGPVALGKDGAGRALVAAVVYNGPQSGAANPIDAIAVARFDPTNPNSTVQWTAAAWVDPSSNNGKSLIGDYGQDGAPGTNDPGEGDGVINASDASIGRLATMNDPVLGVVGPSLSAPSFDAAGNLYFIASVSVKKRINGQVVNVPTVALIRGLYNPSTFCYQLEDVLEQGAVFHGANSTKNYQVQALNLSDGDSISSASLWSSSSNQATWNNMDTSALSLSDPRNLGGLVLSARICYDIDGNGTYEDPTVIGGNAASPDEAYNVVLFLGNTTIPFICGSADFNHDGDTGTDADIEAFFQCIAGNCCPTCDTADFNGDGDVGTDADIEAFFRVLAGGTC